MTSLTPLLLASAAAGIVHATMPDHWAPIAVVVRSNRWSTARTARSALRVSGGHLFGSLILGALVIAAGMAGCEWPCLARRTETVAAPVLVALGAADLLGL